MLLIPIRSLLRVLTGKATCADWLFITVCGGIAAFVLGPALLLTAGSTILPIGPTPTPNLESTQESVYAGSMEAIIRQMATNRDAVTNLLSESNTNPGLLKDGNWLSQLRNGGLSLGYAEDHLPELQPPLIFQATHQELLVWASEWKTVGDLLVQFVDTGDPNYLHDIGKHSDSAQAALERGIGLLGAFTPTPSR